jgi:nucleoside 2-deoxyribosyltransferase
MSQSTKDIIFKTDVDALDQADLVVALVTGQDIDSGTASEIGYMYANKKPVIAITAWERRYRNLFTEGMFSSSVNKVSELLLEIQKYEN